MGKIIYLRRVGKQLSNTLGITSVSRKKVFEMGDYSTQLPFNQWSKTVVL